MYMLQNKSPVSPSWHLWLSEKSLIDGLKAQLCLSFCVTPWPPYLIMFAYGYGLVHLYDTISLLSLLLTNYIVMYGRCCGTWELILLPYHLLFIIFEEIETGWSCFEYVVRACHIHRIECSFIFREMASSQPGHYLLSLLSQLSPQVRCRSHYRHSKRLRPFLW